MVNGSDAATVHIYVVKMAHVMLHIHTQNIKCYIFVSYPNNKKKREKHEKERGQDKSRNCGGGL